VHGVDLRALTPLSLLLVQRILSIWACHGLQCNNYWERETEIGRRRQRETLKFVGAGSECMETNRSSISMHAIN
jgi:hypothetical protein